MMEGLLNHELKELEDVLTRQMQPSWRVKRGYVYRIIYEWVNEKHLWRPVLAKLPFNLIPLYAEELMSDDWKGMPSCLITRLAIFLVYQDLKYVCGWKPV
jgi:hypothetical protein